MGYSIDCHKVNPASDCHHVIQASSEDELMKKTAEHARKDHGMELTPQLMAEVRKHIQKV